MNTGLKILLGLLGVAGVVYLASDNVRSAIESRLRFENVRFSNWKFSITQGLSFDLDFDIRNLLATLVRVEGFSGNILLGGQVLSKVVFNDPLDLTSNESKRLSFNVKASIGDLGSTVKNIINGSVPTSMRLVGNAFVAGGASVAVDKSIVSIGG